MNKGQLKFAVHVLKQGYFFDSIDEVMSNRAKIPKGLCTVWKIFKYLMTVKLGTQAKDKQTIGFNSMFDVTT
jgi:hypothetical protein